MSVLNNSIVPASASAGAGGYTIDQSLRFNDDDSAYLSRTPSSAATSSQKMTYSVWVKRGNISLSPTYNGIFGAFNSGDIVGLFFYNNDRISFHVDDGNAGILTTTQKLRDPSSWIHIVISIDTTLATAADRVIMYINGSRVTVFDSEVTVTQYYNFVDLMQNGVSQVIGKENNTGGHFDGLIAEFHAIDGQALSPTDFGETGDYGEWKPIEYTGTYGTNGFYLDFADSADLGNDVSGEGNDWTSTNLAATDQMLDSPTNNFATFNSVNLTAQNSTRVMTLKEGNLQAYSSGYDSYKPAYSTMGMDSGKWYWEILYSGASGSGQNEIWQMGMDSAGNYDGHWSADIYSRITWRGNTGVRKWSSDTGTTGDIYPSGPINNSVYQFAYDADTGKSYYGVNNTWYDSSGSGGSFSASSPVATSGTTNYSVYPMVRGNNYNVSSYSYYANFGQDSSFAGNKTAQSNTDDNGYGDFYYEPPTGYLALCTQNLPDPAVIPSEHFNTVLYTGNGGTQSITGVGFQPDWVWTQIRSQADDHNVYDAVRGTTKFVYPNGNWSEQTISNSLTSFDSDGFTLGSYSGPNWSGRTFVAWCWNCPTTFSGNTNGTITSSGRVNTDAGFSIVSYTGTGSTGTVGHGLSSAPEFIFYKNRDWSNSWWAYHKDSGHDGYLNLDRNIAWTSNTTFFDDAPTATLFNPGSHSWAKRSGEGYIAYCFHSVDGYSKVGSYTGNGSTDGTFVYTGFRPAYVMLKLTSSISNWVMQDSARDSYNAGGLILMPNNMSAEMDYTSGYFDFHSNGFKLRNNYATINGNGSTYIYLAFAEHPFKHTNAR